MQGNISCHREKTGRKKKSYPSNLEAVLKVEIAGSLFAALCDICTRVRHRPVPLSARQTETRSYLKQGCMHTYMQACVRTWAVKQHINKADMPICPGKFIHAHPQSHTETVLPYMVT